MVAQKPKINKNEPGDTQKEAEAGRRTRVSRSNFHYLMCTLRLRIWIDKAYFRFCRILIAAIKSWDAAGRDILHGTKQ